MNALISVLSSHVSVKSTIVIILHTEFSSSMISFVWLSRKKKLISINTNKRETDRKKDKYAGSLDAYRIESLVCILCMQLFTSLRIRMKGEKMNC